MVNIEIVRKNIEQIAPLVEDTIVGARASMSLQWLQEKERATLHALKVFRAQLNSVGVYAGPSSDWMICKRLKYASEVIQKRIAVVQRMNDRRNKVQLAKRKHLADIGALVDNGLLPEMRRRLDRLEASKVAVSNEVTQEQKEQAKLQYQEIFEKAAEEEDEIAKQAREMKEIFGIETGSTATVTPTDNVDNVGIDTQDRSE